MRFYLDENLSPCIAVLARGLGLDVVSAHEAGTVGFDDRDQLLLAARDGRCLVTRDRADFIALTVSFFEQHERHAGVLLLPRSLSPQDFPAVVNGLYVYERIHGDAPVDYVFDYLPGGRDPNA